MFDLITHDSHWARSTLLVVLVKLLAITLCTWFILREQLQSATTTLLKKAFCEALMHRGLFSNGYTRIWWYWSKKFPFVVVNKTIHHFLYLSGSFLFCQKSRFTVRSQIGRSAIWLFLWGYLLYVVCNKASGKFMAIP